jgi:hypothetical protein
MSIRRISGGLGLSTGISLILMHALHVAVLAGAPAVIGAAVRYACHIP